MSPNEKRERRKSSALIRSAKRNGRVRRWLALALGIAGVLIGVALICLFRPSKEVSTDRFRVALPRDIDQVEPEVRTLIQQLIVLAKAEPLDARHHGNLGLAYEANGLWVEAEQAYSTAVELDASNRLWRFHLAITKNEVGDFTGSLNLLQSLLRDAPDIVAAQQRLGHALLQTNDLKQAEAAFRRVIELAPKAAEGYAGLADVQLRQGRLDSAIQLLQDAISRDEKYRVPHFLLGTAYRRQGRLDLAARELGLGQQGKVRFLPDELSPQRDAYTLTVHGRHQRGIRQMAAGQFSEAAVTLEGTLRAAPQNVAVMNLLAGAYMQLGRKEEALRLLQDALRIDETHATTHINLASWFLHAGQPEPALKHAEIAVERADWLLSAHRIRVQVLIRMARFSEAFEAVNQALRIAPKDASLQGLARQLEKRLNRR